MIDELEAGSTEVTLDRLALLDGINIFDPTVEIVHIAQVYMEKLIMPQEPQGDAFHLAIASFYNVDILLTWNCTHLANPNKFDFITRIEPRIGINNTRIKNTT